MFLRNIYCILPRHELALHFGFGNIKNIFHYNPSSWLTPNTGKHVTKETLPAERKFIRTFIATLAQNLRTSSALRKYGKARCKQNKRKVFAGRFVIARERNSLCARFSIMLRALPLRSVTQKTCPRKQNRTKKPGSLLFIRMKRQMRAGLGTSMSSLRDSVYKTNDGNKILDNHVEVLIGNYRGAREGHRQRIGNEK